MTVLLSNAFMAYQYYLVHSMTNNREKTLMDLSLLNRIAPDHAVQTATMLHNEVRLKIIIIIKRTIVLL